MHALPAPGYTGLVSRTTWQPAAILVVIVLAAWYLRSVRAIGAPWPARRTATFFAGLALFGWTTCGWPEVYRGSLFWAWGLQTLALLLIVPLVGLAGQPLQLARLRQGHDGRVDRFLRSRAGRTLGNPLIGPALVPVVSALLFFGPVPSWAAQWAPVAWALQLLIVAIGSLIVLPLVGPDQGSTSLAVGLSLAIGSFELVLDAVPGIALRLHTTLATSYFDHRIGRAWSPAPLHDQQIAGAMLWCVAEVIDLPFLLLVFRRWLRADARDAAEIDAVLEAERAARGALESAGETTPEAVTDAPWWITDPTMQRRYRS